MNFFVLLSHFVGWVVTIPILIYLVISFFVSFGYFLFYYMCHSNVPVRFKMLLASRCGFKRFWFWLICVFFYSLARISENEKNLTKPPAFSDIVDSSCWRF
jgi:hypothetical protein